MSWQFGSEWSYMWKPLKFWTLEVCSLCSTRVLRVTRLTRRGRHTLFCGCFCRIGPNFPVFGKTWLGTTKFRGGNGILYIIKNIELRVAYVYIFWIRNTSAIQCNIFYTTLGFVASGTSRSNQVPVTDYVIVDDGYSRILKYPPTQCT